ncbi:hypothetical protein Tco_1542239 [Tanacetum coccineum]
MTEERMYFLSFKSEVWCMCNILSQPEDVVMMQPVNKSRRGEGQCGTNYDYVCRGLILYGMSDSLFDIYQNVESSKELWDSLEAKYMTEEASSKKFLVSNFTNYKMTHSRPVLE